MPNSRSAVRLTPNFKEIQSEIKNLLASNNANRFFLKIEIFHKVVTDYINPSSPANAANKPTTVRLKELPRNLKLHPPAQQRYQSQLLSRHHLLLHLIEVEESFVLTVRNILNINGKGAAAVGFVPFPIDAEIYAVIIF